MPLRRTKDSRDLEAACEAEMSHVCVTEAADLPPRWQGVEITTTCWTDSKPKSLPRYGHIDGQPSDPTIKNSPVLHIGLQIYCLR
jgi:hypothetical protein